MFKKIIPALGLSLALTAAAGFAQAAPVHTPMAKKTDGGQKDDVCQDRLCVQTVQGDIHPHAGEKDGLQGWNGPHTDQNEQGPRRLHARRHGQDVTQPGGVTPPGLFTGILDI